MVFVEVIIYVLVLGFFFSFKHIKKLIGYERTIKLKDSRRYNIIDAKLKQKPLWLVKAHYGFLIFIFTFSFIGLTILLTFLWTVFQKAFVFTDPDAVYFDSSWGITAIPALFMVLPITNLILESLPFKTARYAASRHYKAPTLSHRNDIKLTLWIFIFFFTIGFPFIILNTDCYSYVKHDSFYINRFFSLSEEQYNLSYDVDHAEVTYSRDSDGDYLFYYYIYFKDNKKIEILNNTLWESEKVVLVNNILKNNKINIVLESISESQWLSIDHQCSDSLVSSLKHLYNIEAP